MSGEARGAWACWAVRLGLSLHRHYISSILVRSGKTLLRSLRQTLILTQQTRRLAQAGSSALGASKLRSPSLLLDLMGCLAHHIDQPSLLLGPTQPNLLTIALQHRKAVVLVLLVELLSP